jgi:hypothetical protein
MTSWGSSSLLIELILGKSKVVCQQLRIGSALYVIIGWIPREKSCPVKFWTLTIWTGFTRTGAVRNMPYICIPEKNSRKEPRPRLRKPREIHSVYCLYNVIPWLIRRNHVVGNGRDHCRPFRRLRAVQRREVCWIWPQ